MFLSFFVFAIFLFRCALLFVILPYVYTLSTIRAYRWILWAFAHFSCFSFSCFSFVAHWKPTAGLSAWSPALNSLLVFSLCYLCRWVEIFCLRFCDCRCRWCWVYNESQRISVVFRTSHSYNTLYFIFGALLVFVFSGSQVCRGCADDAGDDYRESVVNFDSRTKVAS